MSFDYTETNGARFDSLNMEKSRNDRERLFPSRRTHLKKTEINFSRPMKLIIAMDDRDRALLKMNRRLILTVGFKLDGLELIGDPSDANNLDRYKYQDRRPG